MALAVPHLVSAYHLEAGGRALEESGSAVDSLLPALDHLQKAVEWDRHNAQACRLLGKAYQAEGDWSAAVQALTRYTELRADNPLGYIELAQLYEAIEAEMAAMRFFDLIAALPTADVEAPDVPADTPFAEPDGPASHSYVARTTFSLSPDHGQRPTLFMHPPARVTYSLFLPARPAVLRFGLGLDPRSLDLPGDGVTFEIGVNGQRIFLEHVDKAMARGGWQERTVDLGPWVGERIALVLAVTPRPLADASGDWAGWGEPEFVDARLPALEAAHPGARLAEAWQQAGLTAHNFIALGEEARKAERYEEALEWYMRAARQEPGVGDPWYYAGLAYEGSGEWEAALGAYKRAIEPSPLTNVRRSSVYYRIGLIYQRWLVPSQPEKALEAFEEAIEADSFQNTREAADAHYQRGMILRQQGAAPETYVAELEQAVALRPEHGMAHILLGRAYYALHADVGMAKAEIEKALALNSQSKWAFLHLGDVYRQAGQCEESESAYQQALEIDAGFEPATKHLEMPCEGK